MTMTAPAALADRCPACGTERNAPPVEPHKTDTDENSLTAYYKCPKCPCKWLVCWLRSALGEVAA